MTTVNQADVIEFLKTKLATNSDLDHIEYMNLDTKSFPVKKYGARIYTPLEDPYEDEHLFIGRKLKETWFFGLDIHINKPFKKDESAMTDAKGVSYWKKTIEELLLHQTNDGEFLDTKWNYEGLDPATDRTIIKGRFECEIINNYD